MTALEQDLASEKPAAIDWPDGIWPDVDVSAEAIDEARREMWGQFPS